LLADVERVDPDGFGQDRLLDGVTDRLVARDRLPGLVDGHGKEGVEAEFDVLCLHVLRQSSRRKGIVVKYNDGNIPLW
jgi:hypothetical protein